MYVSLQLENQLLIESSSGEEEGGEDDKGEVSPHSSEGLIDMEDMGKVMKKMKAVVKKRQEEEKESAAGEPREMVTPMLHKALSKQG